MTSDGHISSPSTQPDRLVTAAHARGVTTLTMDSPRNRNALSAALITQLMAELAAATEDERTRVIVLSHAGPVFSSGADLKETAAAVASNSLPVARLGDLLAAVAECPKPVVARVGGPARAGGIGLIAAADLSVCTEQATFAFSEVRLGVIPSVISATVLPRLAAGAAAELYLTGSTFDGVRAAQIGLVTAAVPAERLDQTVEQYCAELVRGAPLALAGVKELLRGRRAAGPRAETGRHTTALREEIAELTELSLRFFLSAEGREGVAAFWEKRDPNWVP